MTDTPLEPMIEANEEWPPIEIHNATVHFAVRVPDVNSLPEVIDLATVAIGRWGVEPLDVIIEDDDAPGRRWMVRNGALYDLHALQQAIRDGNPDA